MREKVGTRATLCNVLVSSGKTKGVVHSPKPGVYKHKTPLLTPTQKTSILKSTSNTQMK